MSLNKNNLGGIVGFNVENTISYQHAAQSLILHILLESA